MSERDPRQSKTHNNEADFRLALPHDTEPLSHQKIMEELAPYMDLVSEDETPQPGTVLKQKFEDRYADFLEHQGRILEPEPSHIDDPEGYEEWRKSQDYIDELAVRSLRTAVIVRRLATPLHQRINQNQPPAPRRINRQGYEIDEFWEFAYADATALPARESGWMYTSSGELVWVEQDPEQLREYDEIKATADQGAGRLRRVLERYIALLPATQQEEIRTKYRLPALEAPHGDEPEE